MTFPGRDQISIVVFVLATSLLLIANPGFFNHDELQKADHIVRYGLWDYFNTYGAIAQGGSFDVPVRPLSFLVQGALASFMYAAPAVTHLLDVLMHAVVAVLLYQLVIELQLGRKTALTISVLFSVAPLTTFSVGWAGALMDRLYVLFGLVAIIGVARYVAQNGRQSVNLALIVFAHCAALLSKETAVMLPVIVFLAYVSLRKPVLSAAFLRLAAASALPVLLYLGYRLPALMGSLAGAGVSHYSSSLENVGPNVLAYWSYPFLPALTEIGNITFVSNIYVAAATSVHLFLVAVLLRVFGPRWALLYVLAYFVPLVPVLSIAGKGSHYLYGSGVALAVALGMLLVKAWSSEPRLLKIGSGALLLPLLLHAGANQIHIYQVGRCMDRALTTLEARHIASGYLPVVAFRAEPGAPSHVLHRAFTGRDQIGAFYPVKFVFEDDAAEKNRGEVLRTTFSSNCLLY